MPDYRPTVKREKSQGSLGASVLLGRKEEYSAQQASLSLPPGYTSRCTPLLPHPGIPTVVHPEVYPGVYAHCTPCGIPTLVYMPPYVHPEVYPPWHTCLPVYTLRYTVSREATRLLYTVVGRHIPDYTHTGRHIPGLYTPQGGIQGGMGGSREPLS